MSPVDLLEACIAQIEEHDSRLRCFITLTLESARQEARAAQARAQSKGRLGPLDGIPLGVKDILASQGVRTTAGSKVLQHFVPDRDKRTLRRETGRRGDRRQNQSARIRLWRNKCELLLRRSGQSARFIAARGGFKRRIGRCGSVRDGVGRCRLRHRRFDPDPGGRLRLVRAQANIWFDQLRGSNPAILDTGSSRAADPHRRGSWPDDTGLDRRARDADAAEIPDAHRHPRESAGSCLFGSACSFRVVARLVSPARRENRNIPNARPGAHS